jgi:hypothetical protein
MLRLRLTVQCMRIVENAPTIIQSVSVISIAQKYSRAVYNKITKNNIAHAGSSCAGDRRGGGHLVWAAGRPVNFDCS